MNENKGTTLWHIIDITLLCLLITIIIYAKYQGMYTDTQELCLGKIAQKTTINDTEYYILPVNQTNAQWVDINDYTTLQVETKT